MARGTGVLAAAIVAALVLLAGCTASGLPATAGDNTTTNGTDRPTVSVAASASVEAEPDLAVVRVAVETTADSAEAARSAVAEDAERMRAALRESGVPDENVSTESFDVHPQYDYSDDERELVGYRAIHVYRIETTPDRAGEVIDVAVGNGATGVSGVAFTLSEETREELRQEALTAAVENARTDAETLADATGRSLGDVRTVSTSGNDGGPGPFYEAMADAGDGGGTVVEPGTVQVRASVTVVYDLE